MVPQFLRYGDYAEKYRSSPYSLKIEDNEDQPLDFSRRNNVTYSHESLPSPIGSKFPTQHRLSHVSPISPTNSESPVRQSDTYMSPLSPANPESPIRPSDTYMSPLSPANPKSPIRKSRLNKSRTPESGVSTGSISPARSSPSQNYPPSYYSSFTSARECPERTYSSERHSSEESNVGYAPHEIPLLGMGLQIAPTSFAPPGQYLDNINHDLLAAYSSPQFALLAQVTALQKLSSLSSAFHNPIPNQNQMSVPQDQSDQNSCTRNLQEKFHIPSSEMPSVNFSHFNRAISFEELQLCTKASYKKFQSEIMLKKRDDNPSKSRRSAARAAPYSSNGRTDPRALEEGGQDANGDSQGESVDMEVDARTRQYQEKRRKNNEAAKKSRDQRKFKEEETAIKAAFYEQENARLTQIIVRLQSEAHFLSNVASNVTSNVARPY